MKFSEFKIGAHFFCGDGEWKCSDIGTRTVVAVRVVDGVDPSGPPYWRNETVFDEYDFSSCNTGSPLPDVPRAR